MRTTMLILFLCVVGTVLACTIGVARGDVTADGRPLLWKNRDVSGIQCVMYDEGYAYSFIGICTVGDSLPWMGVNDAGFAILNALSSDLPRIGNGETMRLALRTCATRQDFEALLDSTNAIGRETHSSMGIIDADGEAVMYEVGSTEYWIFDTADTEDGYVVRSNFSINGGGTSGIQKYERSLDLLEQFTSRDSLCAHVLLQHHCRDFCDGNGNGIAVPYQEHYSVGFPWGYIPAGYSICNNANGSACVIEGLLPGEAPNTTTMWSLLGHPATAIAVPCWPGIVPPSAISADTSSPMAMASANLRNLVYDCEQTGGSTYIDTYKLDDGAGGGLWSQLFPLETGFVDSVQVLRAGWVSNPPSAATLLELEAYFANNGLYALNYAAVNQIPSPAFSAAPLTGNAPLTVQFTDMTPHQPDSLAWDMNGDGVIDTCGVDPTWTYCADGYYTVTLWAANEHGTDSLVVTNCIHVGNEDTQDDTATLQGVSVWPNPAHGQANIAFSLVAPASVELHIYDIRGRLMRTLQPGLLPQGEHTLVWDGRSNAGAPVASGVYLFQMRNGRFTRSGKVILLK